MEGLKLLKEGVYVIWDWNLDKDVEAVVEPGETSDTDTLSESESTNCSDDEGAEAVTKHTVTFKCIGATRYVEAQKSLQRVSEKLRVGQHVSVDVLNEPDNPFDSRAIAFKVLIDHQWCTVGYVVREAVEHVHRMLESSKIESVKFSWTKYMVTWSRSGPGYYAEIDITVKGKWLVEVVRSASTH